jgi:nucleotide-binding universal stress UspA family protein
MNFKKILLAVDASENAMRAVEYVGAMAGGGQGFEIELLCIERLPHRDLYPDEPSWKESCEETRQALKEFLTRARARLIEMGVPETAVSEAYKTSCTSPFSAEAPMCSKGTGIAQEIMDALKEGGFGTVVVGRRGVSKAEEFLFGSVSNRIIHSAKDCTVWVVA